MGEGQDKQEGIIPPKVTGSTVKYLIFWARTECYEMHSFDQPEDAQAFFRELSTKIPNYFACLGKAEVIEEQYPESAIQDDLFSSSDHVTDIPRRIKDFTRCNVGETLWLTVHLFGKASYYRVIRYPDVEKARAFFHSGFGEVYEKMFFCVVKFTVLEVRNSFWHFATLNRPERKPYPVAIWLVPAQEQQGQIQEVISGLAGEHSNSSRYIPVFHPHVTLFTGVLANHDDLAEELRALFGQVDKFCARQKQESLAVKEKKPVDQRRAKWSQFLFVVLETNGAPAEALDLKQAINTFPAISNLNLSTDANDDRLEDPAERHVMLHFSLMYNANSSDLSNIVEEVTNKYTLPDRIAFEAIQIVTPRSGDWKDILTKSGDVNTNWDVIYTRKL